MPSWLAAFAITAVGVMVAVPMLTGRAFEIGWFERSTQTRRARHERRPTHGGAVTALALLVGAAVTGLDGDALEAVAGVVALALLAGHRAERDRGPDWLAPAGWVATALVVPLAGVRAELTGTTWIDVVLTAAGLLALTAGLDAVDHTDGTAPAVAGAAAGGLLAVAVHAGDPVVPLAGALLGACLGLAAHSWPPSAVRIGWIGPMVLGPILGIAAVQVSPGVSSPRSALVPLLILGSVAAYGTLPRLDRRLQARGLPPHLVLPLVTAAGAIGGAELARDELGLVPSLVVGAVPLLALIVLGRPRRGERDDVAVPESRRTRRLVIGVLGAVIVATGGLAIVALLSARDDMERGRVAAIAGLDAARAGDLETAQARFARAADAFADAKSSLTSPFVRVGDVVPVLAPNLEAARTLADIGGNLSSTAVALAVRAGADEMRVVDGRFPVEQSRAIGEELGTALDTLRDSVATLDEADSAFLIGQLRDGRQEVRDEIADAGTSLEVAAEATRLLPSLLGADGERRWMVAVLSSSELRGAGGLLGDFAELRASGGDLELVRSIPASAMNQATDQAEQIAALPPVYQQTYAGFQPWRFWQNLSVTPDAATMSEAIATAYPLTDGGGPVDGVVTIDPIALSGLLELTGPIRVPGWPTAIDADNVVQILLFDHYQQLDDEARDLFQGVVVGEVVRRLTTGTLPAPSRIAAALAPAVAGGHLRLWSADTDAEALFDRIGADGRIVAPGGTDYVQLLTQNRSEAKIDWFLRRSLTYDVEVDPTSGALTATATVRLTNDAPASGVSSYIIGETTGPTQPGVNDMNVTIVTPHLPTGALDEAGNRLPMSLGLENGLKAVSVRVRLAPGTSTTIRMSFEGTVVPGPSYHLDVGRQPAGRPDLVEVAVTGTGKWAVRGPAKGRARFEGDRPASLDVGFKST